MSVFDERTGEIRTGLDAGSFTVKDGDTQLDVVAVRELSDPLDILVLADTSMVGQTVRPIADALISLLGDDETMGVVGFSEAAELLQDFTLSKKMLYEALERVDYEGIPRLLDALFATIDGGFEASGNRRAVILLSAGVVAGSRSSMADVVGAARSKRVVVHSVFVRTIDRSLLRQVSLRTGGAIFASKRIKLDPRGLARRILAAARAPYELEVSGVYSFGDRLQVTVRPAGDRKAKLTASALPLE